MAKYIVTRVRQVLEGTSVLADSAESAIEESRHFERTEWGKIDDKRRKNYKAELAARPTEC